MPLFAEPPWAGKLCSIYECNVVEARGTVFGRKKHEHCNLEGGRAFRSAAEVKHEGQVKLLGGRLQTRVHQ